MQRVNKRKSILKDFSLVNMSAQYAPDRNTRRNRLYYVANRGYRFDAPAKDRMLKWLLLSETQKDYQLGKISKLKQKAFFLNEDKIVNFLIKSKSRISIVEKIIEKIKVFFPDENIAFEYIRGNEFVDGGMLSISIQTFQEYEDTSKQFCQFEEVWWNDQWFKSEKNISVRLDFFEYV